MPPDGCPAIRRDQPRTAGPWPAGEGLIHSNRRTWAGNEGLEHPVQRPALLAESYVNPQRQRSLLGDSSRRVNQSLEPDPG